MIIKCKMCGGDITFTPGATYGTCEYCGSTSTIPQAEDETKLNRYNRANHFRRQCEFDKALAAYEKLLEQDDMLVSDVAGAVGFDDANYFSRVFKKETGQTPREFRRSQQQ